MSKFINKLSADLTTLGAKLYYVGGFVRDELLGVQTKDIDLVVTGIEPKIFENILSKHCKVQFVGKSFGVYKCFKDGQEIDIAFPRKEVSTGDLHIDFIVEAGPQISLQEDLRRRDFTVNAIAKEVLTGEIIDPYGGVVDLRSKKLRQLSNNSIKEDYLRALRAIQFVSRFGFDIEEETLSNIKKYAHLLDTISFERVGIEMSKFFKGGFIVKAVSYLKDCSVWEDFYKDISMEQWEMIEIFNRQEAFDELSVLAMYLYFRQKFPVCLKVDGTTKLRTQTIVQSISSSLESSYEVKKVMNVMGLLDLLRLLSIRKYLGLSSGKEAEKIKDMSKQIVENNEPYLLAHLVVNGDDLIGVGLKGKQVGKRLSAMLDDVMRQPENNTREYLLNS